MTTFAIATAKHAALANLLQALAQAHIEHRSALRQFQITLASCESGHLLTAACLANTAPALRAHLQAVKSASEEAVPLAKQLLLTAREKRDDYLVALLLQYPAQAQAVPEFLGRLTVAPQTAPDAPEEFLVHDFQTLESFEASDLLGGPLRFVLQLGVSQSGKRFIGRFEGTDDALCYLGTLTSFEELSL